MVKTGVTGVGSWGVTLSFLFHNNGHEVTVWSILKDEITESEETHEHRTLPGVHLPETMIFMDSPEEAMADKDLPVLAVPPIYTRTTVVSMKPSCRDGQILVNVVKNIEESTLMTLSEQTEEEFPMTNVAVLSGPGHVEEVSRSLPTTCVTGARDRKTVEFIQDLFMSLVFRVYTSPDILGVELDGPSKSIIALAAGIADGPGYGDSTKAVLITKGITEIAKLGTVIGGEFETFRGLSGVGDLIVTCASVYSRNRRAGILVGQGRTTEEVTAEMKMVMEGIYSAEAALVLSGGCEVSMPIIEQVNQIFSNREPAADTVKDLMIRDKMTEASTMMQE